MGVRLCPGLLTLAVVLAFADGQTSMQGQTCDQMAGHRAVIQPDADAFIAGFFSMHSAGDNGVGCGNVRSGGVYTIFILLSTMSFRKRITDII